MKLAERLNQIVDLSKEIERASEGLGYEEMMKDNYIVELIATRDKAAKELEEAHRKENEILKQNPFWAKLLA